ncbi:helix-turn-helix domain-containing protein [Pseudarthrobacter phenanthrenivorans]|uniref:helix-turn-helix domain-containing protein n=1 Tax=Pseudarthrobacter phenanthrenivorans TaxID=361575 RepID=UPI0035C6AAAC
MPKITSAGDGADASAPRVYTVAQLADILQIDPRTIRTKARAGSWPSLDLGPRTIRFTQAHLETILASSEATPPQPLTRLHRRRGEPPRYAPTGP